MKQWHGYFIIKRVVANLGASNWAALIALIDTIQTQGDRADEHLVSRFSLDGNMVIYEGHYRDSAISFDKFANKLADAFPNVTIDEISYNTAMDGDTVYATYIYNAKNRFHLGLFGCTSENDLCTKEESAQAARDYIASDLAAWEEVT